MPIPLCAPDSNRLEEDVPVILSIIEEFNVEHIIVNTQAEEILKGKMFQVIMKRLQKSQIPSVELICPLRTPAQSSVPVRMMSENAVVSGEIPFPQIINVSKAPTKPSKPFPPHKSAITPESPTTPCLILVHMNSSAQATLLAVSHDVLLAQAKVQKMQNMLSSARMGVSCFRSHNGLGFLLSVITSIYVGNTTFIMSPGEFYLNPFRYFEIVDRFKGIGFKK
jgi:hypothetical protein